MAERADFRAMRDTGAAIRVLDNLDFYLEEFERIATARGTAVHWAETAADVNRIVCELAALICLLPRHGTRQPMTNYISISIATGRKRPCATVDLPRLKQMRKRKFIRAWCVADIGLHRPCHDLVMQRYHRHRAHRQRRCVTRHRFARLGVNRAQ